MSEKNCGTCGWWKGYITDSRLGNCSIALPDCVLESDRYVMHATGGTSCPCWKERE